MTQELIRVTDETTREEIVDCLGIVCAAAHRQPCVIGTADYPSGWDVAHHRLDALLTELDELA